MASLAEEFFHGLGRYAAAEPVESDEDARSTCTQRDPRRRPVRRSAGQWVDAR